MSEPLRGGDRGARRRVYDDARVLASDLGEAVDEAGHSLRTQLDRRPYVTLGAAAGVGYVLGGGLASRLTVLAFGIAGRMAVSWALREAAHGLRDDGGGTAGAPWNGEEPGA